MRGIGHATGALVLIMAAAGACSSAPEGDTPQDPVAPAQEPEAPRPPRLSPELRNDAGPGQTTTPEQPEHTGSLPGAPGAHFVTPVAPAYDLRFTGVGFEPHDGKVMQGMVVRTSDSLAVALTIRPVQGGLFRFEWTDLLVPGGQYRLELFASDAPFDECHMPPDHAWRVHLPEASRDLDVYFERTEQESQEACDAFDNQALEP